MKKRTVLIFSLLTIGAIFLHILALINLFPLLLSIPLLFIILLSFLLVLNNRKRFKGF